MPRRTALALRATAFLAVLAAASAWAWWRTPPPTATAPPWTVAGGDPRLGRDAIRAYGCGACHRIDGLRDATGRVGPELIDFRRQMYIAGVLPNEPDHLVAWIRHPRQISPRTAMPDLDVSEDSARHIAAYLYSQRAR